MTNIATTIRDQIRTIDPSAFPAWGTKDMVALPSALQFRVGGMAKFKGLVRVNYNHGSDAYDVEFLKMRKGLPVVVDSAEYVLAPELVNVIDAVVQ